MKILVFPEDANPYQVELYREMARLGHQIRYAGGLTRSHTLNLILLPIELAVCRTTGYRILHLHWVYPFCLPIGSRIGCVRRAMRWWFGLVLRVLAILGTAVVWIAHNVMPHEQVFDDDAAGRRRLLRSVDALVVHSPRALAALEEIGPLPSRRYVVRHPAYELAEPPSRPVEYPELRVLFFGNVVDYKGVPDLLRAAQLVLAPIVVTVAGACKDQALRREVEALADERTHLHLERQTDDALAAHLAAAHVVALPFRRVTTSGSALYALSAGRALIVPDAPTLSDLPADIVFRYDADPDPVAALALVLESLAARACELSAIGRAAREWARNYQWSDLAGDLTRASMDCMADR